MPDRITPYREGGDTKMITVPKWLYYYWVGMTIVCLATSFVALYAGKQIGRWDQASDYMDCYIRQHDAFVCADVWVVGKRS